MNYTPKTAPYAHQQEALSGSWELSYFGLFMEMGTGKTKVAIDTMAMLFLDEEIDRALIFAPKGVYATWVNTEIPKHLPDDIERRVALWRSSGTAAQKAEIDTMASTPYDKSVLKIMVVNIEALSATKKCATYCMAFLRNGRAITVVDESTTIKNPKAERTKKVIALGNHSHFRRILTGSPVTRSPLDLYSQFDFLRSGLLGFTSYWAFRARYAIMGKIVVSGRSVDVVTGFRNLDELSDRVRRHSYMVRKEDCLDLPPKVYEMRHVELTSEQARIYHDLKTLALSDTESGTIVATEAVTRLLRMHQVVCGIVSAEGEETLIGENRTPELLEIAEETDGKIIVWANYRANIRRIYSELSRVYPNAAVQYWGATSEAERATAIHRFQNDPHCRFFVGNPQTAGYGLTLTAASTVVYYSNNFDLEKRQQSEDRCHRIGQTRSVTYIDLVAQNTVDEKIIRALRKKINIVERVMKTGKIDWLI